MLSDSSVEGNQHMDDDNEDPLNISFDSVGSKRGIPKIPEKWT
jgi:hypothetical protein